MTAAEGFLATFATTFRRYLAHPLLLGIVFGIVHLWLAVIGQDRETQPLADVQYFYQPWVHDALSGGPVVGIDTPWVYPIFAFVPMLIADVFGPGPYVITWLVLVTVLDAAVILVITGVGRGRDRRRIAAAWWWLGFLVLLGPIAVGRIDSVAVPLAIVGMLVLLRRPRLAAVLLTLAAWIKVWPAALVAAAIITLRDRVRILVAAALTSAVIVLVVVALGGARNLFSFITQLTGRGIELEAPMGVFWMWNGMLGGPSKVVYDSRLLAFEVTGPGILVVGAIVTVLLAVVVLGLFGVALLATRRGIPPAQLLPPLALALTTAFLVFNKVGSPQYVSWLAVPILVGLVASVTGVIRDFRAPAALGLLIAVLTQFGYPNLFQALLELEPLAVMMLTARDALYVVMFVIAVIRLVRVLRPSADRTVAADTLAA